MHYFNQTILLTENVGKCNKVGCKTGLTSRMFYLIWSNEKLKGSQKYIQLRKLRKSSSHLMWMR